MKVALVTTPPSVRSGIGDYARHLAPYLAERCELQVHVPDPLAGEELAGHPTRPAGALAPREVDRILYQLGNERAHAFMVPMVRSLGGVVMLHDWVLFDLATAAYPALARGGLKGHLLALREGGPAQARRYARTRSERRAARRAGMEVDFSRSPLEGPLLEGWHAPEPAGRWTARQAGLRLMARPDEVRVELETAPGRRVALKQDGRELASFCAARDGRRATLRARPGPGEPVTLALVIDRTTPTREQRSHGDPRQLGCFVRSIEWSDAGGTHQLDLSAPAPSHLPGVELSRDRFRLPLNRSVVRFGDAFLVHSEHLRRRILEDRNAHTPIGLVPHGAERRWRDEPRATTRARLGLPADGLLLVSFGAIQEHKRIDVLLDALARARRECHDLHLVLAGENRLETWNLTQRIARAGLSRDVTVTGFLEEPAIDEVLHAADLCVNLRGPSTGGTSGGILRALSMGRGVIASELLEQAELPSDCVPRIAPGEGESERLARLVVDLAGDGGRRAALESAARAYVAGECHWSHVAERTCQHLESFPTHRTNRRSLVHTAIEHADRRRAQRDPPHHRRAEGERE